MSDLSLKTRIIRTQVPTTSFNLFRYFIRAKCEAIEQHNNRTATFYVAPSLNPLIATGVLF